MARSRISEDQVIDTDFMSQAEHDDPDQVEVQHHFIYNIDVPTTYSGSASRILLVNESEDGLIFSSQAPAIKILYNNNELESTTTSTSFITKVNITSIDAGNYIVMWYFEWASSSTSNYFKSQIGLDTLTVLSEFKQVPVTSDNWYSSSGFTRISLDSNGHSVYLNYCSSKDGKISKIRKSRLAIWGV